MASDKSGLNGWGRLGFGFLLLIMIIMTTSSAIASQEAARAAKNTDLIAQCTTPGTKCSKLTQQQEARRTAQNKCIIDAIITLPPVTDRILKRQEILDNYDKCVEAEAKVIVTSTTSTLVK